MSGYTPGPYTAHLEKTNAHGGWGVTARDGQILVATVYADVIHIPTPAPREENAESIATAQLFAAAPALVDALRDLLEVAQMAIEDESIDAARAALAAAGVEVDA